jgi:hypothetical protein
MGHVLDKWVVGSDEYFTPAIAVTMDADKTATAYFVETTELQYNVNITTTGNGFTTPPAGEYTYNEGTELELFANPTLYNAFVKWTVNGEEITDAITDITVNENTEIIAEFVETYQLNLSVSGSGTTNPEPGDYTYINGSVANIFASPALGNVFEKWVIDDVEFLTQYVEIAIDENTTAIAYFVPTAEDQYTLSISAATIGGHTIPPTGDYLYIDDSNIELTAIPENGYIFEKWIVDGFETTINPLELAITEDYNISAYFEVNNDGINDATILNTCSIFPNPSNGNAIICSEENINKIQVSDITGKLLNVFDVSDIKKYNLTLENYKPGIYIIHVSTKSSISTLKMQILK